MTWPDVNHFGYISVRRTKRIFVCFFFFFFFSSSFSSFFFFLFCTMTHLSVLVSALLTRNFGQLSYKKTYRGTTSMCCLLQSSWWACVCLFSSAHSTHPSSGMNCTHSDYTLNYSVNHMYGNRCNLVIQYVFQGCCCRYCKNRNGRGYRQ